MKRQDIIKKLMKEGITEKTLVNMTDKQLTMLSERFFSEQYVTSTPAVVNIPKEKTLDIANAKAKKQTFATYESEVKENELKGATEKKSKSEKEIVLKRIHERIKTKMNKGECIKTEVELLKRMKENVPEKLENYIKSKTKKLEKEVAEQKTKTWVNKLIESRYLTSKNEIMELVRRKLTEQEVDVSGSEVDTEKLPDFLTYDAIMSSADSAQPATKPAEPGVLPKTKPGTNPGTRPAPRTPYEPGIGPKHNPKAMEEEKKVAKPPKTVPKRKTGSPYKPGTGPKHNPKA